MSKGLDRIKKQHSKDGPMTYTIGHTKSYLQYFEEQPYPHPMKLGKRADDYEGGSIWKTESEAQAFLDKNGMSDYSVFGVEADWETDTELGEDGVHCLLKDAPLVILEKQEKTQ